MTAVAAPSIEIVALGEPGAPVVCCANVGAATDGVAMATIEALVHWKYIDHFKTSKNYLKIWYLAHRAQIDEGVKLGKANYPEKK